MRRASTAQVNTVSVCGIHAVAALLKENRVQCLYVSTHDSNRRVQALAETAAALGVPLIKKSRRALTEQAQEERHQGVVAVAKLPAGDLSEVLAGDAPFVVLDGVTDPRNLGAIMRTVRAFAGAAVVVAARRNAPLSAVSVRASAGAAAQIPLIRVPNLARALREMDKAGRFIWGVAQDGQTALFSQSPPSAVCWVLGGEGDGIGRLVREHCHQIVRIPTVDGDAGCLNVSSACAICLAAACGG